MPEPAFDPATPAGDESLLRAPRPAWDAGGDRSHVKTFVLAAALMAAIGLGALAVHADVASLWRRHFGPPLTTDEMRTRIAACERDRDLECAQDTLVALLQRQPGDAGAVRRAAGAVDPPARAARRAARARRRRKATRDLMQRLR